MSYYKRMKSYNRIKYTGQCVTAILFVGGLLFSFINKNPAFGYWLLVGSMVSGARFYTLYKHAKEDYCIQHTCD